MAAQPWDPRLMNDSSANGLSAALIVGPSLLLLYARLNPTKQNQKRSQSIVGLIGFDWSEILKRVWFLSNL